MNKSACLELSILELREIVMYEFWFDYVKQKYSKKGRLSYINTDSFIFLIKPEDIYEYIAKDVDIKESSDANVQKNVSPKGNLNLKITKIVQQQLRLKIK